jgi:hypothetical protein
MASPLNRAIVAGMTDALHGWAVVQCEQKEGRRLSAADCPPAASKACRAARVLTKAIEEENGMSLDALLVRACEADRHPEEEARYAPMFGAMLVHMALATGLSWFDDHARFPLRVPEAKFGYAGSEEYRASKPTGARVVVEEVAVVVVEETTGKKAATKRAPRPSKRDRERAAAYERVEEHYRTHRRLAPGETYTAAEFAAFAAERAASAAARKPNPASLRRAPPAYPATRPPTISSQRFLDPVVVQDKIRERNEPHGTALLFRVFYVNATAPNGKKFRVITDGHHRLAAAAHEQVAPKFVHDTKAQKTADRLGKRYLPDHKRDADWYDVRTGRRVRVSS